MLINFFSLVALSRVIGFPSKNLEKYKKNYFFSSLTIYIAVSSGTNCLCVSLRFSGEAVTYTKIITFGCEAQVSTLHLT